MPFDGHKDDYESALVFHGFYQATIQGLFTYYDTDKWGRGGVSNGVKFDPREALTFDKLFDRLLSMKRGKNVGIPKCIGPYHEIIPTQKEMPKMTFDDKAGIGLGWQTMSEKDGEILIVNGM